MCYHKYCIFYPSIFVKFMDVLELVLPQFSLNYNKVKITKLDNIELKKPCYFLEITGELLSNLAEDFFACFIKRGKVA